MKGLITKGIGGFYYVLTEEGTFQAKGRGIFKKKGLTLAVGDQVEIEVLPDGDAVINSVEPRKNQFIRPPIANVDTFVVVFALKNPKPNFSIIDKFLIMAEQNNIEPVICVNKCDLAEEGEIDAIRAIYENVYPVVFVSGSTGEGIEELKEQMKNRKVAFAGPSGVGKSTITNRIIPEANMETGDISTKTNRGKHTTRHVEIFRTGDGGMIFDTPGFTSFDILDADEQSLMDFYPEIEKLKGECRFDNCFHLKEPGCKVREAVENGQIHQIRYDSYVANMNEIKNKKKY